MGAIHKLDLTSDVTHLLVGDSDTPKYKYVAKLRPDVRCLRPEWVEAVRNCWIDGGETDVEALEAQYTLPVFAGLRICVTGFEDLDFRQRLMDLIAGNGGDYSGDLTKDVTHLIARTPEGKKYSYAGAWDIKIVSTEWLSDSLERGMILDESLYHPLLALEERGKNAWIRRTASTSTLGKRAREDGPSLNVSRKLRRTASAKLGSQHEGIWTDIVGGGFGPQERTKSEWDEQRRKVDAAVARPSRVDTIEHASTPTAATLDVCSEQGYHRSKPPLEKPPDDVAIKRGLFQGKRFFIHGFDQRQTSILQKHLASHDAEIMSSITELSQGRSANDLPEGFLIVPHTTAHCDLPLTPESSMQPVTVTDMWVEKCLHRKAFVQPHENIINTPLSRFPIPGFSGMKICSTGFSGIDLRHVGTVLTQIGAVYEEYFTRKISVLICSSSTPTEKLRHALDWNVPAVSADWLWACVKQGVKQPYQRYLIETPTEIVESRQSRTLTGRTGSETHHVHEPYRTASSIVRGDDCRPDSANQHREQRKPLSIHTSDPEPKGQTVDPPQTTSRTSDIFDGESCDKNSARSTQGPIRAVSPNAPPLQEVSPNSPTKQSSTPLHPKTSSPSRPNQPDRPEAVPKQKQQDSVATSFSTLRSHTKQSHSTTTTLENPPRPQHAPSAPPQGRRRRTLFGRAASNVSARSNSNSISISISRASSVDTLNTDGLGTPVESTTATSFVLDSVGIKSLHEEQQEDEESTPRGTQLGYHDPEVGEWREKMVRKMAAKSEAGGGIVMQERERVKDKEIGTVKDVNSSGRATRQRGLRRSGF